MVNKNYVNGRNREYRSMEKLRKEGYNIILRSAGSHSIIDVLGFRKSDRSVCCIQCKPKSMSTKAKNKLITDNGWLFGKFTCEGLEIR